MYSECSGSWNEILDFLKLFQRLIIPPGLLARASDPKKLCLMHLVNNFNKMRDNDDKYNCHRDSSCNYSDN